MILVPENDNFVYGDAGLPHEVMRLNSRLQTYAAFEVGRSIALKAKKFSVLTVHVKIAGLNKNYEEVLRAASEDLTFLSIAEVSPIAFNGTRLKRRRRT